MAREPAPQVRRRLRERRSMMALVALAGALALVAFFPASASATHFTGSTKTCAAQNPVTKTFECVLSLAVLHVGQGEEKIVVDIAAGPVGAEFATAPTRTGG